MKFLGVPWGLRPRRTEQELALSLLSMLPSAHIYRVGVRVVCFRGSIPTPPILYLRFAGSLTVAAQDSRPSGSLLLSCKASSSSASCRFIPAHKYPHFTHLPGDGALECNRLIATVDLRYVNIARAKAERSSSLQHTVDTVNSCTSLDPVLDRGSISDQPLAEAIGKLLPS